MTEYPIHMQYFHTWMLGFCSVISLDTKILFDSTTGRYLHETPSASSESALNRNLHCGAISDMDLQFDIQIFVDNNHWIVPNHWKNGCLLAIKSSYGSADCLILLSKSESQAPQFLFSKVELLLNNTWVYFTMYLFDNFILNICRPEVLKYSN